MKQNSHSNNILLTGVPRSGTTLTCSLVNQARQVVALVEPFDINKLHADWIKDGNAVPALATLLQATRDRLISSGEGPSRVRADVNSTEASSRLTNTFAPLGHSIGLRDNVTKPGIYKPAYGLIHNFRLIVKHPNAFTALLPELVEQFQCYAVIRNPVAVLSSWSTLNLPIRRGYAPAAERFSARLRERLNSANDDLHRQIILLNWYFDQYSRYLSENQIIRYESIVANPSVALSPLIMAGWSDQPLGTVSNFNSNYNRNAMEEIQNRLISIGGEFSQYYTNQDILTAF